MFPVIASALGRVRVISGSTRSLPTHIRLLCRAPDTRTLYIGAPEQDSAFRARPQPSASCQMAATATHHDHDWSAMSDYRREEAINETRSRQTNEWIEAANDRFGADNPMDEYRCECSDLMCADVVSLTRVEYEAVRSDGLRFFIATHHENPELDQLLVEHGRYSI